MNRTLVALFLGASVTAACSSPSSAPGSGGSSAGNTVMGTVAGKPFTPADAVALKGVYDSSYPGIVTIVMGNMPHLCELLQQLHGLPGEPLSKANFVDVGFTLGQTIGTSTVVTGTYTPSGMPNELDSGGWDTYDSACNATHSGGTSSATVTLTSVGQVYAGTFDMTFEDGTKISGSFNAPLCTLDLSDASSGMTSGDGGSGTTCIP